MADIQDIDGEVGEIEAVQQQTQAEEPKIDLPEKYRGKSVEDVVRMHQEAEKLIANQSREVGEVRKLADELIKSQLAPKPQQVEKPEEVDFFTNPQEAIRNQIENNPRVIAAEAQVMQMQREAAKVRLAQKHPDMGDLVKDAEFANWVNSSKVRQRLFQQADAYDVDAADELFSTFKELRTVRQRKEVEVDTSTRDKSLSAASVDSGGSGESGRKIFRRADLIRLKMSNPSKYEAMSDEIMAAYSEGRVK